MAATKYYPEDVLVEKFQSNEYGWLDYVNQSVTSPSMRKAQSSLSSGRETS